MTTIHTAMAMFFSQNDSTPSHASGPVNDTPTKAAGTSAEPPAG